MPQHSNTTLRPRISPGERNYLRQQSRHILLQGGSEADVVNFVQTHRGLPVEQRVQKVVGSLPEAPQSESVTQDNLVSGLSLNALQGITFGFGDEAMGALLGILTGEGASGGIESYRERLRQWNQANPGKAFGAELLGGFLTGVGAASALKLGKGAASFGAKVGTAALEGAAGGAVAGAGYAEGDITDRAKAALFGGALGGTLSPAFAGIAHGAGTVLKPATRAVLDRLKGLQSRIPGLGSSQGHAMHFLLETLEKEGLDVDELQGAVMTLRANGVNPTLADVGGEGTLGLLTETLSTRTPVKQQLAEQLMSRQAEQGARLSGGLFRRIMRSTNFGLKNAYDAVDELVVARANAAKPLYEEAYQHIVPTTPRIKQILGNSRMRAAWEEGRKIAQTEELAGLGRGLDIPELPATSLRSAAEAELIDLGVTGERLNTLLGQLPESFPETLPVRGLDYMKKGLDTIIRRGLKGDVLDRTEIRALRQLREELLEFADEAVPSYGQARTVWGGTTQAIEAVELGQEFAKKAPPVVAREINNLIERSPGLADFYRLGAAQSLYEMATGAAGRKETADIANRVFGGRIYGAKNQDALRIQALFPDAPEVAEDFMRQVAAEARLSHTARAAGSSRSGRALQELEEQVEGPTPPSVRMSATLTFLGALRDAVVRGQRRFSQEISDELAVMFSRGIDDPLELDMLLERLAHEQTRRLMQRRFGAAVRSGVAADIGLLSGKVTGSAR